MSKHQIRVAILHPGMGRDGRWIHDFVPDGGKYQFVHVPDLEAPLSWHQRGSKAGIREWKSHFAHVASALRQSPDVVVTNFPQLALAAAFRKTLSFRPFKLVGWSYNLGDIDSAMKGRVSGLFLRNADRLIVHSREEISRYAAWHGMSEDRFQFVPLQRGALEYEPSFEGEPYAVAMGSAGRDYETLIEAARGFEGRLILIAKPDLIDGLSLPSNVEHRSGLSLEECYAINAGAKFSVVPIKNLKTASGQVTFIASMALRCPVIATDCPGTRDYLKSDENAVLVPPFDARSLRDAMNVLWSNSGLREQLGGAAYDSWENNYSDPVAAKNLLKVLDAVTGANKTP